jgi:AraC-like DNA-binding protein
VDVFYIFKTDTASKLTYLAFPHINTAISFFKGVSITRNDFHIMINEDQNAGKFCVEILGKYARPVVVDINGIFEEVAVIFKPLGVNRFIEGNLLQHTPGYSQSFPDKDWNQFCKLLFEANNKIETIESFLLNRLTDKEEFAAIEQSLILLEDTETDLSIADIAERLGMNLKTFQRHFTRQMACSPTLYRRIARFRRAMQTGIQNREIKSLTRISYDSNYFDQSYFIKEFKRLTHLNPKKFFRQVSLLDDEKIVWEIK